MHVMKSANCQGYKESGRYSLSDSLKDKKERNDGIAFCSKLRLLG